MDAKGIDVKFADNITIWNLRGNALPMDQLVPKPVSYTHLVTLGSG